LLFIGIKIVHKSQESVRVVIWDRKRVPCWRRSIAKS